MEEAKKTGRPKFKIDFTMVEKLAGIQCTQEEIASFLGCSTDTLRRSSEFCDIYKKGTENGKMSIRRMQYKLAEKNTAMAIWLGKQYLGQRDDASINLNSDRVIIVNDLPKEDND